MTPKRSRTQRIDADGRRRARSSTAFRERHKEAVVPNGVIGRLTFPATIDLFISIIVSFNLALAQPVLDLIGNNPEFFIARDAPRIDIVLVAFAWTVALPLIMALVAYLVTRIHDPTGHLLHGALLGVLVGILVVQVLERVPVVEDAPGAFLVVASLVIAAAGVLAYYARPGPRSFVRFGAPVPLLVLAMFFFFAPVSKVLWPEDVPVSGGGDSSGVPVVMVVFDELPLASLMNEQGGIDRRLFPNFAALSGDSTWFRNTTSVAGLTDKAVPALLDGRYPRKDRLSILGDHPDNLFTRLGPGRDVISLEPITSLCPAEICRPESPAAFGSRWQSLSQDLFTIGSHIALPDDLTRDLPPIDQQWGNFAEQSFAPTEAKPDRFRQLREDDPRRDLARFFRMIKPFRTDSPNRLYFLHSLPPHNPWRFLPSGQQYRQTEPVPGSPEPGEGRGWTDDEWLVTQAWQRHLLQVQYADGLLGRLLDRLRSAHVYDRALMVVVADHGTAFLPGEPRRAFTPATIGHLAAVPLFVKKPEQARGRIDDRPAQTTDVFPTILDLVGIDPPQDLDGRSLFDESAPRLEIKHFNPERIPFPAHGAEKYEAVEAKYRMFSSTGRALDPFRIGPGDTAELVGRPAAGLPRGSADGRVTIEGAAVYDDIDPAADPFPALVSGTVESEELLIDEVVVAIVVNDRVAAVTRTYGRSDGSASFYAMLSPTYFSGAGNALSAFLVDTSARRVLLRPLVGP